MLTKTLRIPAILLLGFPALLLTPFALGQTASPTEGAVPEGLSKGDWAGIRAAYEAGRHAAYPVAGGYQARNPGQAWRTHFDGRGFLTQPDAGGWTWGLELECYGFAGKEREVTSPARVSADGGRVAYAWDATLEEWYVNDTRGLEHGYTVHRRPARDEHDEGSPLTFTLAVRGELRAKVAGDGRGVRFLDESGAVALTYMGLSVFDADGRELEASFEDLDEEGDRLLLSVDERGARYPLVIDPIAQQAYLKASNTDAGDRFGSVAISGNTVVVGAVVEDSNATGVNGNQSDNSAQFAGAAYVFDLDSDLGTAYCTASPNSSGGAASISASGSASVAANDLLLRAEPVPNQPGIFFYGPGQMSVPFGNGTLCVAGPIARLDVVNATGNVMTFLLDNTSPPSAATQITPGSTWHFQACFRDPAAGGAFFDLSNGLSIFFVP